MQTVTLLSSKDTSMLTKVIAPLLLPAAASRRDRISTCCKRHHAAWGRQGASGRTEMLTLVGSMNARSWVLTGEPKMALCVSWLRCQNRN
jgi:hypothetical protein